MSKQSEAKKEQGYQPKPVLDRCRVCENLIATELHDKYGYPHERLMCGIGEFRVAANAVCNEFKKGGK